MSYVCCFDGCKYRSQEIKKEKGVIFQFFFFPKNEQLRNEWAKLCQGKESKDVAHIHPRFSTHFEPEAYERSLYHVLLHIAASKAKKIQGWGNTNTLFTNLC